MALIRIALVTQRVCRCQNKLPLEGWKRLIRPKRRGDGFMLMNVRQICVERLSSKRGQDQGVDLTRGECVG